MIRFVINRFFMRTGILVLLSSLFSFFVQAQQIGWNVELLSNWFDSNIPFNGANNRYNEVWGFTWEGREYGVIGSRDGAYILEVTTAEYPRLVKYIPGADTNVTNRDYHDYNGYLYMVADQGKSTLQIVDLHSLPDSVSLVYDSDTLFDRCHNIFIDSAAVRMYACSVKKKDYASDLKIYSLEDPLQPELLLDYDAVAVFHDIYVRHDTAFGNNAFEGLFVYDFTDLSAPKVIGALTDYPGKGYNHAGWATEDGQYYIFGDETHGSDLKVCDVTDVKNMEVVATFNSGSADDAVAHNQLIKGDFLYVSYYHDGFQMYDVIDPLHPIKVGYYHTYPHPDHLEFKGAWGVYPFLPSGHMLVSDREKGLFVLDVRQAWEYALTVREYPEPLLDIFPNPFSTRLTISTLEGQSISSVSIYDLQGRELLRGQVPETSLTYEWNEVGILAPGAYFIRLKGENLELTRKLIKSF